MKKIFTTAFLFFLISCTFGQDSPLKAYFGLYIKDLRLQEHNKDKANLFTADFYWWIRSDATKDSFLLQEVEKFEFVNSKQQDFHIDEKRITIDSLTGASSVYLSGHMKGDFIFEPDYRHYPFDKLILPIQVESYNLTSEQLIFVPDPTAYENQDNTAPEIAPNFSISTFSVISSKFNHNEKVYETSFGDPKLHTQTSYSSLTFEVLLQRKSLIFLLKILIPIFLIALMAYLVFYLPVSMVQSAAGLTVTSLLACIALQLSLGNSIPTTGYLIATDKLFYLTYALITSSMILSVYTYNLDKGGKEHHAKKIKTIAKWAYPIILIVFTLLTIRAGLNYYP